ncbi:MAG: PrsW family intramembrane metalloprotease [Eubacterium sp.]|jgi:RsiW-degrading membrane proteinase PrsW (M82 family)
MFLFVNPFTILIAAAVIPAIILLIYVYKKDKLEREPTDLIWKLVLWGIVSTLCAVVTESIGSRILNANFDPNSLTYRVLMYFVVVGLSEEGFKYMMLRIKTWRSPYFNCQFDGVVYAVAVSLGFALWENIQYVISYGMGTALLRAVTAVPGHACFGVFMGTWYGVAKKYDNFGYKGRSAVASILALVFPTLIHGLYDFIATDENGSSWPFFVLIIVMFIIAFFTVKKTSEKDQYI